jgi:hypothetical protein
MSVFFASTEEKLAVQNLGILFIPCSLKSSFHALSPLNQNSFYLSHLPNFLLFHIWNLCSKTNFKREGD